MRNNNFFKNRFSLAALFAGIFIAFSLFLRICLLVKDFANTDLSSGLVFKIFAAGLFYDLVACSYFLIPLMLYLALVPRRWFAKPFFRYFTGTFFFLLLTILVFDGLAEWLFWDEFNARFNFIAVDYLIYTTEVIGNIRESYPLPILFAGIAFISGSIFWLTKRFRRHIYQDNSALFSRLKTLAAFAIFPILAYFLVESNTIRISQNSFDDELAHNGIYQLFSAYLNNELDYNSFYKSNPDKAVFTDLRHLLQAPDSRFTSNNIYDLTRRIESPEKEQHYNVMFITVESFSAEFLAMFGNKDHITPNLDTLMQKSMVFSNLFATGTRTIRGLEALTLCLPPTPGFSIVKRPHNENLFSSGAIFRDKGYDTKFIYGGYGYFDNMNYFFGNNGFKVVDRADFADNEITFANNWGVCDGDLFNRSLREADASFKAQKPFFSFLMTTSNHRPYTYPSGKIDIPSHSGRNGAVKYTDFAITTFLKDARKHAWFKNTLFVIVADHCASSAGKTDVPIEKYHIPAIIYAPGIIKPQVVSKLASQIDLVPTLLGLMHFDYNTKFFGQDLAQVSPHRVFVGTYQKLGYLDNDYFTVLSPKKETQFYKVNMQDFSQVPQPEKPEILTDAIAYYQGASYLFSHGKYKFVKSGKSNAIEVLSQK